MKEPKIVAEGLTNEQIYAWMKDKAQKASALRAALAEKQQIEQVLVEIESRIDQLTSEASI
ncbi:hypothetical protein [Lelliottia wanjuensis]|uniref:Uncharacterized protein n=1 Tax=Lelliottia wanjuensis TaxID=3050585 RepID=A0AAP4FUX3_9ENTR|nr:MULTISPECIES: hypothetical protein [unclassified Lelliottia]MDK9364160.1 hypothetical protein [Lelliottia sp. V106_12]MDK9585403.1 hypothetical protein [Lelliottia sp. V86_10]MDK9617163.1 hypothetical protein [Lelliottia sp. V106_9]